mmetsp:Transcript_15859/g.61963  ORF Transcript_15859/g.61963 Transcript_15859/m.61963 type:complete len:257 (-) Transcript_15859:31-801(-)
MSVNPVADTHAQSFRAPMDVADEQLVSRTLQAAWAIEELPCRDTVRAALAESTVLGMVHPDSSIEATALAGIAAAFPSVGRNGRQRWEVDLIGTHPAARRRGVAATLLTALLERGREAVPGPCLCRALIRVDNIASQGLFASKGFVRTPQEHYIWTREYDASPQGAQASSAPSCHMIPVDTLLYAGLWLEDLAASGDLVAELTTVERHAASNRRVAGAVLPVGCTVAEGLAKAGYTAECSAAGPCAYQWWHAELGS